MKSIWIALVVIAAMAFGASCTGLNSELANLTSPSGLASLIGTWQPSAGLAAAANSCTILQWQITGQAGNSLSGTLSAQCAGGILATGNVTGQLNGDEVVLQITGNATVPGLSNCPFSVNGVAHMEDNDTLRISYSGTTCEGPVHGEEALRRPTQAPPPPPASVPSPEPPPVTAPPPPPVDHSQYHVGPGPLTTDRAYQVVSATAVEYPVLSAAKNSQSESLAATGELLLRMIWHLRLAGFEAGRQLNPSGALSKDKLAVKIDGAWRAFDVFRAVGTPGVPADVIFFEVWPADYYAYGGLPD
jgi:hypothetical protein